MVGMVCSEHFQSHDLQMIKGKIHKLVPGAIPSIFLTFGEKVQIPEIPLSPEVSESPKLTTLTPEIAAPKALSVDDGDNGLDGGESDQYVNEDVCIETQENTENTANLNSELTQCVRNRLVNNRRWKDKARNLRKRVYRLRTTAKQISQSISEMKKQKKKDAELLNFLEVCIIDQNGSNSFIATVNFF